MVKARTGARSAPEPGDPPAEINIPIRLRGALARDCQKLLDPDEGYYGSASELRGCASGGSSKTTARRALRRGRPRHRTTTRAVGRP